MGTNHRGKTTMGAEPGSTNRPDHHDRDTNHTPPLHAVAPHSTPGGIGNAPENVSENPEWCYDQPAKTKRGKHRRYHGLVKRVGGSEGERIRRELAATIYELLVWAKQQQQSNSEMDSREEGAADDNAE